MKPRVQAKLTLNNLDRKVVPQLYAKLEKVFDELSDSGDEDAAAMISSLMDKTEELEREVKLHLSHFSQ